MSHWIEHNEEHAGEFLRWADKAGAAAPNVLAATECMGEVIQTPAAALGKLGGAGEHGYAGEHLHFHEH